MKDIPGRESKKLIDKSPKVSLMCIMKFVAELRLMVLSKLNVTGRSERVEIFCQVLE